MDWALQCQEQVWLIAYCCGNEGIVEHDLDRTIDNLCAIASKKYAAYRQTGYRNYSKQALSLMKIKCGKKIKKFQFHSNLS